MADLNNENKDLDNELIEDENDENSIESILTAELAKQEEAENEEEAVVEKEVETATEEAPEIAEEEAVVVTPTEADKANKVPGSLPTVLKDKFAALDPEMKAWAHKREAEVATLLSQTSNDRKIAQEVSAIAQPYVPMMNAMKTNASELFKSALSGIYTLQQGSTQQKADFLTDLMSSNGFNSPDALRALDAALTARFSGTSAPTHSPNIDPAYAEKIDRMDQHFTQQRNQEQQYHDQRIGNEIDTFKAGKEFFDEVAPDMQALLQTGRATNLQDAYDKACRMNDSVQKLTTERTKAAQARKQATNGSLKSRGPSSAQKGVGQIGRSIDDILKEQMAKNDHRI